MLSCSRVAAGEGKERKEFDEWELSADEPIKTLTNVALTIGKVQVRFQFEGTSKEV